MKKPLTLQLDLTVEEEYKEALISYLRSYVPDVMMDVCDDFTATCKVKEIPQ